VGLRIESLPHREKFHKHFFGKFQDDFAAVFGRKPEICICAGAKFNLTQETFARVRPRDKKSPVESWFSFLTGDAMVAGFSRNHFAGSATGVNWPMGLSLISMSS
jgi:hypothetical protein